MALDKAKEYLKKFNLDGEVIEHQVSTATVPLAAQAIGCTDGEIAKSLTFKDKDENAIMIVVAGDTRIDNKKFKAEFKYKAKMLSAEEVNEKIGHEIGGVCPFGINEDVKVYLDKSLQKYEIVYPACGAENATIKLSVEELFKLSNAIKWVDIAKED